MARINVIVATTSPDVKAEGIAEAVTARSDMTLVGRRPVAATGVHDLLKTIPSSPALALIIVGPPIATNECAERWLAERADLMVLRVDLVGDAVSISLRDPQLEPLLDALRALVERVGDRTRDRVVSIQLRSGGPPAETAAAGSGSAPPRPLLVAAIQWIHTLLRDAIASERDDGGDVPVISLTRATLLQSLDARSERAPEEQPRELAETDAELDRALAAADPLTEPLAAASRAFALRPLQFRVLLLALAPELDHRFQRCMGFLLDDMSRRVGTLGLYCTLLGATARIRGDLALGGALGRWQVFESSGGRASAADEPLRLDPYLALFLIEGPAALKSDPRVRRLLRRGAWPGADLLTRREEGVTAATLAEKLQSDDSSWILLGGEDGAGLRALVELAAKNGHLCPVRIEAARLADVDVMEVEECALRLGRLARLTRRPLVVDVPQAAGTESEDDSLRTLLRAVGRAGRPAAVICPDAARIVRLLGPATYGPVEDVSLSRAAHVAAVRAAAAGADAYVTEEKAQTIASSFPLGVDGLEHAMRLARTRPRDYDVDDPWVARFTAACKEVAAAGVSQLADRIEPVFTLEQVVLPLDRKQQLLEIVDHVRLAPRVLDGWRFREQLPYGRGVTALFFGGSGTGKTMASLAIARALGVQILRLDLSRVVSKYIGDTEKHIDCVFRDGRRSGSAIVIDEAEALLGKRSEVKDAHDRYANIEVAYLLQRMEAYEGLVILTTNMRQNLDAAFLRRLRFIVEFPRPDAEARERIWRQCLPEGSHALDDAAFRLLARRIELTGGHLRQITLRAAFIAAAAGTVIGLPHVAQAARAEFAKLGMPPVEIDPHPEGQGRVNADAILRVTEALRDRLRQALLDSGVPGSVFVGPLDDADASGAALVLFLYRIVPNPSLRNSEHRTSSGTGQPPVRVFLNALPLDLYYLLTVGTTPNSSEETLLRALGFAMQALQAEPDLMGASVGHEAVRLSLEPLTTEESSRIWALFPTANYRTSIAYLATPVWIDPRQPEAVAAAVREDQLRAGPRAQPVAP